MAELDTAKLAAYRLAQLSPKDRRWVLAQLSSEERRTIDRHLNDLRQLSRRSGIRFSDVIKLDSDVVPTSLAIADASTGASPSEAEDISQGELNQRLGNVSQTALASILDEFSPLFVAVLAAECDRVASKYLAFCSPERAKAVRTSSKLLKDPLPPRVLWHAKKILIRHMDNMA